VHYEGLLTRKADESGSGFSKIGEDLLAKLDYDGCILGPGRPICIMSGLIYFACMERFGTDLEYKT
jgi:hypothetical protein